MINELLVIARLGDETIINNKKLLFFPFNYLNLVRNMLDVEGHLYQHNLNNATIIASPFLLNEFLRGFVVLRF